jgi:SET domain-containing protein
MSSQKEKLYDHLLNDVYCKLGVSGIHGIGVFALRDIPAGTAPLKSMVTNKEIKFSRVEMKKVPSSVRKHLAMFCLIEKGRVFAPEVGMNAVNLSVYLNHSKQPNLKFDDKDVLRATRDIVKGEELMIDYDESFDDEHDFSDGDDDDFAGSEVDPQIGVPGQRGKAQ